MDHAPEKGHYGILKSWTEGILRTLFLSISQYGFPLCCAQTQSGSYCGVAPNSFRVYIFLISNQMDDFSNQMERFLFPDISPRIPPPPLFFGAVKGLLQGEQGEWVARPQKY